MHGNWNQQIFLRQMGYIKQNFGIENFLGFGGPPLGFFYLWGRLPQKAHLRHLR